MSGGTEFIALQGCAKDLTGPNLTYKQYINHTIKQKQFNKCYILSLMLVPLSSSSVDEVVQCAIFFYQWMFCIISEFEGYVIVQKSKLSTSPETGTVLHIVQMWHIFQDGLHWKWTIVNGNLFQFFLLLWENSAKSIILMFYYFII